MGLYDGILIKDNHLAAWKPSGSVAEAIEHVRAQMGANIDIEVEVDTLEQMVDAMRAKPQIILLDNMTTRELTEAVAYRDQHASEILLEASGGVNLTTVAAIAATGVDRISIGALTHSAPQLDLALDWGAALKNSEPAICSRLNRDSSLDNDPGIFVTDQPTRECEDQDRSCHRDHHQHESI